MKNGKWLKANFHAHSFAWAGFTNGRENISIEMKERYKQLGYDIASISDYMKINSFMDSEKYFIPVYEHGFGFTKNHQLVIGAETVNWIDYPYFQSIDHKQKTLNEIKNDNNIIVLNHPHLRNAYSSEDFSKLTNYDCIEIVNQNFGTAIDLWDDALSSGNVVFCLADDDSHHSNNFSDMGRCYTLVNTDAVSTGKGVLKALKQGRMIAVDLNNNIQSFDVLKERSSNLSVLTDFQVQDSSFTLNFSKDVSRILFTGQGGIVKDSAINISSASYRFSPNDTYIRTSVICRDGSKLYLNPVIRYSGTQLPVYAASVNETATIAFRTFYGIIGVSVIMVFLFFRRRKYKKEIPAVSPAD